LMVPSLVRMYHRQSFTLLAADMAVIGCHWNDVSRTSLSLFAAYEKTNWSLIITWSASCFYLHYCVYNLDINLQTWCLVFLDTDSNWDSSEVYQHSLGLRVRFNFIFFLYASAFSIFFKHFIFSSTFRVFCRPMMRTKPVSYPT
jgi:hypothetical protein